MKVIFFGAGASEYKNGITLNPNQKNISLKQNFLSLFSTYSAQ